jgi:hypothetical protein
MSFKNLDTQTINISEPPKTGGFIPGLGKIIRSLSKGSDPKKKPNNIKSVRSFLTQSKSPPPLNPDTPPTSHPQDPKPRPSIANNNFKKPTKTVGFLTSNPPSQANPSPMGSDFCSLLGTCNKNHEFSDKKVIFAELFKALSKLNQKLVGE